MLRINRVTNAALQQQTLLLDDGSSFSITLYYRPIQRGWFVTELVYGDFTLREIRVVNSPNMLNQWRNKLPFGLACFTEGNREPTLQEDFQSETAKLYVLTQAEVDEFAEYLTSAF
jgi:hypothetical protein